jgi:hypothetical protein
MLCRFANKMDLSPAERNYQKLADEFRLAFVIPASKIRLPVDYRLKDRDLVKIVAACKRKETHPLHDEVTWLDH